MCACVRIISPGRLTMRNSPLLFFVLLFGVTDWHWRSRKMHRKHWQHPPQGVRGLLPTRLSGRCPRYRYVRAAQEDDTFSLHELIGHSSLLCTDYNSVWPSGINTAATWDQDLMYQRGYEMGLEFRGKGINFALGPGMNMLRYVIV